MHMPPIIPQVTCRKCQRQYSSLRGRCPHCGTKKARQASRTAADTASVKAGTASRAKVTSNAQWQLIFGVILIVAVIVSVIALISMSLGDGEPHVRGTPTPSAPAETYSPTHTLPPATPTPIPVQGIELAYEGTVLTEFAALRTGPTPIKALIYPIELDATVTWSVGNEAVIRIEEIDKNKVNVFAVGTGNTKLVAECGGIRAEVSVYVS